MEILSESCYRQNFIETTAKVTDKNGFTIAAPDIDEWGGVNSPTGYDLNLEGIEDFNNYTGHPFDNVFKGYFAQARIYAPEIKRFISPDIIVDLNRYAYSNDNPINRIDPDGNSAYALEWAGSMWRLAGVDLALPVGDAIYVAGIGALSIADAINTIGADNVARIITTAPDALVNASESVKRALSQTADKLKNGVIYVKDRATEGAKYLKEKANQAVNWVNNKLCESSSPGGPGKDPKEIVKIIEKAKSNIIKSLINMEI
jgi:RHS repeat-associated protein